MVKVQRDAGWIGFLALATAVYGCTLYLTRLLPTRPNAEELAVGMTLDLVVVVPTLFWWTVVRRRGWPLVSVVPVILASLFTASRILPSDHQATLHLFELAAPVGELALFGYAIHRVRRALRRRSLAETPEPTDLYDTLRGVLRNILEVRAVADVLAYELGILVYGFSPRRREPEPVGFSYHRRSGYGAVLGALALAGVAEIIAVHLLLTRWSPTAAGIHFGLSVYGGLWLLGDFRAMTRRPILATMEDLQLRCGIRWQIAIPWHQVQTLRRLSWSDPLPTGKDARNLTVLGRPGYLLELTTPQPLTGPYGLQRLTRTLTFAVDEPRAFEAQLQELGVEIE